MLQALPGQQLTGDVGLWVNGVLGYAYELTRNGVVFQSGNWKPGPLYTVQASDVESVIALLVIATNRSGSGPIASSSPIFVVTSIPGPQLIANLDMTQGHFRSQHSVWRKDDPMSLLFPNTWLRANYYVKDVKLMRKSDPMSLSTPNTERLPTVILSRQSRR